MNDDTRVVGCGLWVVCYWIYRQIIRMRIGCSFNWMVNKSPWQWISLVNNRGFLNKRFPWENRLYCYLRQRQPPIRQPIGHLISTKHMHACNEAHFTFDILHWLFRHRWIEPTAFSKHGYSIILGIQVPCDANAGRVATGDPILGLVFCITGTALTMCTASIVSF